MVSGISLLSVPMAMLLWPFVPLCSHLSHPSPGRRGDLRMLLRKGRQIYSSLLLSHTRLLTTASLGIHAQELQWLVCKGSTPSWRSSTNPLENPLPSSKILVHDAESFLSLIPSTNLGDCHTDYLFHTLAFSPPTHFPSTPAIVMHSCGHI